MPDESRTEGPADLEQARPRGQRTFSGPEPQEARGAPGSRGKGEEEAASRTREAATPKDVTGVGPDAPLDPEMPYLRPGDQGG